MAQNPFTPNSPPGTPMPVTFNGDGFFPNMLDVAALLEAGRRTTVLPVQKTELKNAIPFIVLRDEDGAECIESLEALVFENPDHVAADINVADEASFLAYFDRFQTENSLIYGSIDPAKFIAVLNDNAAGEPRWRDHRVTLTLTHSEEWNTWTGRNGRNKAFEGQVDFAEWLEDQLPDIIDPANGKLLELVLAFKVKENITFSQATRLQDGQTQLQYNQILDATAGRGEAGEIRIPGEFTVLIPVFKGLDAPKYPVQARFRYRLLGGKLTLWYELIRPHKVVEEAFKAVWNKIATTANRTILLGKP